MWRRPRWFDTRGTPRWQRFVLAPLLGVSWLYAACAGLVRFARAHRLLPRERLSCDVVSVGNLSVGGSAKTPLAAWVALALRDAGLSSAILSRGYGRRDSGRTFLVSGAWGAAGRVDRSGDEPEWLGSKVAGVPVWVASNRVDAGRRSIIHFGTQVAVLDDGFQHTKLYRDLDLVAVDGVSGFGNGAVLPRGPLREPPTALRHADAVVVVDGPLHPSDEALLARWAPLARRYRARRSPARLWDWRSGEALAWDALAKTPIGMLCGIAQPESFRRTLHGLGARVGAERLFPDHHPFRAEDLARLGEDASTWVVTEKDALKFKSGWRTDCDIWVLAIEIEIDDAEGFRKWLVESLRADPQSLR